MGSDARKYLSPKVRIPLPTVNAAGQLLTEAEKQEFMVKKQEAQRQAQGFRPSDPTPNRCVGYNVYQHPVELAYDKDLVYDRMGPKQELVTAQKFWRVGGDHSSTYDLIYYDKKNVNSDDKIPLGIPNCRSRVSSPVNLTNCTATFNDQIVKL